MAGAGPFAAAGRQDVDASHRVLGDSESNLSGAVVDQNGILVCFGGMRLVVSSAFQDGFEIARLWLVPKGCHAQELLLQALHHGLQRC